MDDTVVIIAVYLKDLRLYTSTLIIAKNVERGFSRIYFALRVQRIPQVGNRKDALMGSMVPAVHAMVWATKQLWYAGAGYLVSHWRCTHRSGNNNVTKSEFYDHDNPDDFTRLDRFDK